MSWLSGRNRFTRWQLNLTAFGTDIRQAVDFQRKWRKLRKEMIALNPKCSACGWSKKLEAHHIQPLHLFPHLGLEPDNLLILCRECHFRHAHYLDYREYNPGIRRLCRMIKEFWEANPAA